MTLQLRDRLTVALGAGMGCQLDSGDVETVARMLVVLEKLRDGLRRNGTAGRMIAEALKPLE